MTLTDKPRRIAASAAAVSILALAGPALAATFKGAGVPKQTDAVGSNKLARVKVSCPSGTTGECTGTLTLKTAQAVKQGSQSKVLTLGRATLSIAAGKTAPVNVKLSSAGYGLLKPNRSLAVIATAASRDGSGHKATSRTKIALKKKKRCNPALQACY